MPGRNAPARRRRIRTFFQGYQKFYSIIFCRFGIRKRGGAGIAYNQGMTAKSPQRAFFSSLTAVILLCFAMAATVSDANWRFTLDVTFLSLPIEFSPGLPMVPVTALIAACGVYAAIEVEPETGRSRKFTHVIVPFTATASLGILLNSVEPGIGWVIILFFGGLLLYSVFLSESYLCFRSDPRSAIASVPVTALAYISAAMGFLFARSVGGRIVFLTPFLIFSAFLISWRIFLLEEEGMGPMYKALTVAAVVAEFGIAFMYLPLRTLSYGVLLFAVFYLMINFIIICSSGRSFRFALRRLGWQGALFLSAFLYFEFTA